MKRLPDLLGLLALLPALACYSYRAMPIEDLRPDLNVRLRVQPEASARVSQLIGYQVEDVEGTVVKLQSDTLLLTVPGQTAVLGGSVQRFFQRVQVPVSQVMQAQQRRLNQAKTYVTLALGAAAGAVLAVAGFNLVNGSGGEEPPVTNNQLVPSALFSPGASSVHDHGTSRAGRHLLLPLGRIPLAR